MRGGEGKSEIFKPKFFILYFFPELFKFKWGISKTIRDDE